MGLTIVGLLKLGLGSEVRHGERILKWLIMLGISDMNGKEESLMGISSGCCRGEARQCPGDEGMYGCEVAKEEKRKGLGSSWKLGRLRVIYNDAGRAVKTGKEWEVKGE